MLIKLVLGLTLLFAVVIEQVRSEDYFRDEEGKIYTIGQWGERRYEGGGYFSKDHTNFRVDAKNIIKFGWNLFKNIEDENFILSPLSPQLLLSYLVNETSRDLESHDELVKNIHYDNYLPLENLIDQMLKEGTNRELKIKNAFFIRNDAELKKTLFNPKTPYEKKENQKENKPMDKKKKKPEEDVSKLIDVRNLGNNRPLDIFFSNFTQPEKVKESYKDWVKKATKNVIRNADIEIDQDTEMILASTIYFKGQWLFSFNKTEQMDFTLPNQDTIKVDAMKIRKKYHSGTFDNLPAKWAAIPYNSTEALVIIMPNEGEDINELIANMTGNEMTEIIDDISGYPTSNWLNITMPKFKISSKINLREPLEKMGIKKIFTSEAGIVLYQNGKISRLAAATQQSSLEIDETGSIGASATAFSIVALTIQRETEDSDFVVDRPFIAVIIDRKYGVPYFIGKISDPSKSE